jgi:hypothetical protein
MGTEDIDADSMGAENSEEHADASMKSSKEERH